MTARGRRPLSSYIPPAQRAAGFHGSPAAGMRVASLTFAAEFCERYLSGPDCPLVDGVEPPGICADCSRVFAVLLSDDHISCIGSPWLI